MPRWAISDLCPSFKMSSSPLFREGHSRNQGD
jgi:hypothetical protein